MKKRLQLILSHAGIASRRHSADVIQEGRVKVDGKVVVDKGLQFDPDTNVIEVDGRRISGDEKKYYFLFNKPRGVISTAIDTHGRKMVTEFFKHVKARVYPVGRLDKDTTGALVVTNDGDLANRLLHPKFEIEKEYEAVVSGSITDEKIDRLEKGVDIDGEKTSPCKVKKISVNNSLTVFRVVIHEGRKRQVRRMFEAVECHVAALQRVRFAGLEVSGIRPGCYRSLSASEVERLKKL